MSLVHRGLFAIWKPAGVISATAIRKIKMTLQGTRHLDYDKWHKEIEHNRLDFTETRGKYMIKVGHGGTLDSFAQGVMVIGLGRECKMLTKYLEDAVKEYKIICELGKETDTLDPLGEIEKEAPWEHVSREDLEQALGDFRGQISQVPPFFSAKKIAGKRWSDIAHKARQTGSPLQVSPEAVSVTIHSLELVEFDPPKFSLFVSCSSGTYMRSLARDIAKKVGSVGHATSVLRTRQGDCIEDDALRIEDWTVEGISSAAWK